MKKVLLFSLLLIAGLIASQFVPQDEAIVTPIRMLTMVALSFIMIHVGYEFEIDKSRPRQYAWDYVVAMTAAAFPWVFVAAYFVFVMAPPALWSHGDLWKEALLEGRFASPTSAGVLFSMLAAAGLGATWLFGKARVLAIFDDLDTILLMIPLKIMMVGVKWQLGVVVLVIGVLLWLAWRYLHAIRMRTSWPWVVGYAVAITFASEAIYVASKMVDKQVPIHLEVLLPAFVLGCMMARPAGVDVHADDAIEGEMQGPAEASEQRVATVISAAFMVLVGLSMPPIFTGAHAEAPAAPTALVAAAEASPSGSVQTLPPVSADAAAEPSPDRAAEAVEQPYKALKYEGADPAALEAKYAFPGWGWITFHVLAVTVLSNIGKLFPTFCYRREATFRERLALSIGMFPRGEVGAGVLVISLSYGLGGPSLTVAVLSLALNLLCTGLFILVVKRLLRPVPAPVAA